MTRDEKIWSTIKFTLLLFFSVTLLYILVCKYVMPYTCFCDREHGSRDQWRWGCLIRSTKDGRADEALKTDIDSLNFDIQQTQRIGEIKDRMSQLQNNYRQHSYNTKYLYCMQAFKTIQAYFDIKQNLYWASKTKEDRKRILEELKTQIQ